MDDGARPGQLSVWDRKSWYEKLVAQGLAAAISGVLQASEILATILYTAACTKGEQPKREEKTRAMTNLASLELRGFVAAKAASSPQPR